MSFLRQKLLGLMKDEEFASVVFYSYIISVHDIGAMMKHYSGVLTSPLPFQKAVRDRSLFTAGGGGRGVGGRRIFG